VGDCSAHTVLHGPNPHDKCLTTGQRAQLQPFGSCFLTEERCPTPLCQPARSGTVRAPLFQVAPFLIKLFEIVSSPASDNLVCWSEHGESFRIVDRTKFAQDVLPLYFKHDNLRSFIRQLNIYGFQRVPNASGRDRTMEFQHPMFTRNGVRQLKEIKRGNQPKKSEQEDGGEEENAGADTLSQPPAKKPRQDYASFKLDLARLQQNLHEFEQDLKEHSMQVQLKLAYILTALDEGGRDSTVGAQRAALLPPGISS